MEQYKAINKNIRVSPQKARLIAGIIRGRPVKDAKLQLSHTRSRASRHFQKTLKSAIANAELLGALREEDLIVQEVRVDEGSRMKRSRPCSKGRAHAYVRKLSHFTVVVGMPGED